MINKKTLPFVLTTNILSAFMFAIKFVVGAIYVLRTTIRPPKKEYDFLHRGKMGHFMWRVQRAKYLRTYVVRYFVVSSVCAIFDIG